MAVRILLLIFWFPLLLLAKEGALVVSGLSGDESDARLLERLGSEAWNAFSARGLAAESVQLLNAPRREDVLAALDQAADRGDDPFWLILLGHGGAGRDGTPVFQLRGPRLSASDLAESLRKFKGETHIFIGASRSGEFLEHLSGVAGTVITASSGAGQINQPRFTERWVQAFSEDPKAPLATISNRAHELVQTDYDSQNLARAESPRMMLATGEIQQPPFVAAPGRIAQRGDDRSAQVKPVTAEDIVIPPVNTTGDFELHPPDEKTMAMLAEANALEVEGEHSARVLRQEIELTVNRDQSIEERRAFRVQLLSPEAFSRWANFELQAMPPQESLQIEGARIILTDGSSYVMNATCIPFKPRSDFSEGMVAHLFFPQVEQGAIVEVITVRRNRGDTTLPAFYRELQLQHDIPVYNSRVTLRLPKRQAFRHRLHNIPSEPEVSETEHSSVHTWQIDALPALELLPFDPPLREMSSWIGISSFASWEMFGDWYRRMSAGALDPGPAVRQKAAAIVAEHSSREGQIRAAYEFVAALRYVPIELGIGAFRPRTPEVVMHRRYGDCKDKAALLVALLREMKIDSRFALINRGSTTDPDFPGWQFNHAIAMVPQAEGDLWLDATETTTPFPFLAPGNIGRPALVFSDETQEFHTVTSSGTTVIRDEWAFEQVTDGGWSGTFQRNFGGLADSEARETYASLTPSQRLNELESRMTELLPFAEFSELRLDHVADPARQVEAGAKVTSAATLSPRPWIDFSGAFASGHRNRALVLNDGQPFRYEQAVRSRSTPRTGSAGEPFEAVTPAGRFTISFEQNDNGELIRTAVMDLSASRIAPEDYAITREAYRNWLRQLQQSIP